MIINNMLREGKNIFYNIIEKFKWKELLQTEGLFRKEAGARFVISEKGKIKLGKNVEFSRGVTIGAICGGLISLGSNVFINENCMIISRNEIIVGNECIFGPNVMIYDHDHLWSYTGIKKGKYKCGNIFIEDGCWIGANVTILENTHIGEKCVIAAGTVVTGDIPAHSLVTGNREISIRPIHVEGK